MDETQSNTPSKPTKKAGYLPRKAVKGFAFWTITLCILISVVAIVLAVWEFAGTDVLWRTVVTCVVVGFATAVFALVNEVFG